MALLDKLDSLRQQSELSESRVPSQSAAVPILMMAVSDEINNHPTEVSSPSHPSLPLSSPDPFPQLSLEGSYQCLQMPRKNGDEVTVVPCDSTNRLQLFSQERCISINANTFNASRYRSCASSEEFHPFTPPPRPLYPTVADTAVTEDESPDPQIYCRYRSTFKPEDKKSPTLCLDIKGQVLTETSILG
jgi:hypothetical protein